MTNLTRYEADGIELVIDQTTGEAFASVRGYARMSSKAQSTVQSRVDRMIEGERNQLTKLAEVQSTSGLQGERLLSAALIFKWAIKDNPELAETMGKVGATVYLHQLAGFKVSTNAITPLEQPNPPLPPGDVRVANLYSALKGFGIDTTNPRYAQALQDISLDILGVSQPTMLPSKGTWVGVVERAEQLGYPVALVASKRSQLGKFVKSCGLEPTQEFRMCNGTQRMVNVYLVGPKLDQAIQDYFG